MDFRVSIQSEFRNVCDASRIRDLSGEIRLRMDFFYRKDVNLKNKFESASRAALSPDTINKSLSPTVMVPPKIRQNHV